MSDFKFIKDPVGSILVSLALRYNRLPSELMEYYFGDEWIWSNPYEKMLFDYEVTYSALVVTGEIKPKSTRDKILSKKFKRYGSISLNELSSSK